MEAFLTAKRDYIWNGCSTSTHKYDGQVSTNLSSNHCITVYLSTELIIYLLYNCTVYYQDKQRGEINQGKTKRRIGQGCSAVGTTTSMNGLPPGAVRQVLSGGWQKGVGLIHTAAQQSGLLRVIHHSTTHCYSSRLGFL